MSATTFSYPGVFRMSEVNSAMKAGRPGTAWCTGAFVTISVAHIPDPTFFYPSSELSPSRIRIEEFKYFNPKNWFLSSRKYDPGCSSRIRMLTFYPSRIRDPGPGVKKAPDPQHW